MNIWLDDERDPSSPEIQKKFGATGNEHWYKNAHELIAQLYSLAGVIESISFDHDLGELGGTGYEVACYIEEQAAKGYFPPIKWKVHSQNPIGRKNIERAMMSAERFWEERLD